MDCKRDKARKVEFENGRLVRRFSRAKGRPDADALSFDWRAKELVDLAIFMKAIGASYWKVYKRFDTMNCAKTAFWCEWHFPRNGFDAMHWSRSLMSMRDLLWKIIDDVKLSYNMSKLSINAGLKGEGQKLEKILEEYS